MTAREQVVVISATAVSFTAACDACAEQAQDLARLMEALGEVLPPVISAAHRHRLEASGARIKVTDVEAGVDAHARFAPEVDLLIHRLRADLRDVERVDVEIRVGEETKVTLANAPFEQGGVLIACQRHYEHVFGGGPDPTFRVHAHRAGARQVVGDFHVKHVWR